MLRLTEAEYAALLTQRQARTAAYQRPGTAQPPARPVAKVTNTDGVLRAVLPVKLVNGSNERAGWWTKAKRAKRERRAVHQAIPTTLLPPLPVAVTITAVRRGTRPFDCDGLRTAGKHIRDAIAELYGVDDGSPLYTWDYHQRRENRCEAHCVVEISAGANP